MKAHSYEEFDLHLRTDSRVCALEGARGDGHQFEEEEAFLLESPSNELISEDGQISTSVGHHARSTKESMKLWLCPHCDQVRESRFHQETFPSCYRGYWSKRELSWRRRAGRPRMCPAGALSPQLCEIAGNTAAGRRVDPPLSSRSFRSCWEGGADTL